MGQQVFWQGMDQEETRRAILAQVPGGGPQGQDQWEHVCALRRWLSAQVPATYEEDLLLFTEPPWDPPGHTLALLAQGGAGLMCGGTNHLLGQVYDLLGWRTLRINLGAPDLGLTHVTVVVEVTTPQGPIYSLQDAYWNQCLVDHQGLPLDYRFLLYSSPQAVLQVARLAQDGDPKPFARRTEAGGVELETLPQGQWRWRDSRWKKWLADNLGREDLILAYKFPFQVGMNTGLQLMPTRGKAIEPAGGPTVSLCLIAKDEEKWLPRCLASARAWVDEIILVDTGSSDSTVEIARAFGARVFHHPWQHDFALHRNQSMAPAVGDWLLILDADEELDQDSAPHLAACLASEGFDSLFVELIHLGPQGDHSLQITPKLIRNHAGISFAGRIHERLQGGNGKALRAPLRIIHHGFAQDPAVMAAKAARNLALVEAWLEEEPENFSAHYYLAQTLMGHKEQAARCLQAGLQALALGREQGLDAPQLSRVFHPILMALTLLEDHQRILQMGGLFLSWAPDYPDPLFSLVWACDQLGDWENVCRHARRFFSLQERWQTASLEYPYPQNLSLGLGHRVARRWALAAARLGRRDEVERALGLVAQSQGEPAARELAAKMEALGCQV